MFFNTLLLYCTLPFKCCFICSLVKNFEHEYELCYINKLALPYLTLVKFQTLTWKVET